MYLAWRSAPSHFASAETLGGWVCKTDLRKYDSPLVFTHDDDVYVVGRRNSRAAAT